jgi:maleate cis-trans isomerase
MHALKVKKFIGVNYLPGPLNKDYAQYFIDAGFNCLAMSAIDVVFNKVQELSSLEVYRFVRGEFLKHKDAEAIYVLGPAWHRSIDVVEMMEHDFGIPVIHHITAQSWEFQKRLNVREPIAGYGRLVAELP